jgi:erythromycin esterase-like protein
MESTAAHGIHVLVRNHDLAWEQIVDIVDDYFRIERERPVQLVGQVMTEGRIDTYPQTGASILEPHLSDSVGWENRWESTFQTIRRQAVVRVIPDERGYLVDIAVHKELEDLPRPEHATAKSATFSGVGAIPSQRREVVSRTNFARQWVPLGRDTVLEQQMLDELAACLGVSRGQ